MAGRLKVTDCLTHIDQRRSYQGQPTGHQQRQSLDEAVSARCKGPAAVFTSLTADSLPPKALWRSQRLGFPATSPLQRKEAQAFASSWAPLQRDCILNVDLLDARPGSLPAGRVPLAGQVD